MEVKFTIEIDDKLWASVETQYRNGKYQDAISNAFLYLTKVIQNVNGIQNENRVDLVLGSKNKVPKIQLNPLRTESERNQQEGYHLILQGIYRGIRNPRAHEFTEDTKEQCEAIIILINHILMLIQQAKPVYQLSEFIETMQDKHFVESKQYVNKLVGMIPKAKLLDTVLVIIDNRTTILQYPFIQINRAIMNLLDVKERAIVINDFSDILLKTDSLDEIEKVVKVLTNQYWNDVKEIARMRIESMIVKSIKKIRYDHDYPSEEDDNDITDNSNLGLLIASIFDSFKDKNSFYDAITKNLYYKNHNEIEFIVKNYWIWIIEREVTLPPSFWKQMSYMTSNINNNDAKLLYSFIEGISESARKKFPEDFKNRYNSLYGDSSPFSANYIEVPF